MNVYVSGAAVKLLEKHGKSSALFQLFLDDIWLGDQCCIIGVTIILHTMMFLIKKQFLPKNVERFR